MVTLMATQMVTLMSTLMSTQMVTLMATQMATQMVTLMATRVATLIVCIVVGVLLRMLRLDVLLESGESESFSAYSHWARVLNVLTSYWHI